MSKRIFLMLVFSLLTVQAGLAQTADYYLERIALHTRLMESKLETPKLGSQFQGDLRRLVVDLEKWKRTFFEEDDIMDVRERLDDHRHMLRASALTVPLDSDQNTTFDLLLLEMENGSQNLTPDSFTQKAIRIPYNLPSKERDSVTSVNQWGGNVGGWGGLCEPDGIDPWGPYLCEPGGIDPWGPYFGRELYPNSGPLWW